MLADVFASTDVGRAIRMLNNGGTGNWGWAVITGFTNAQNVTAEVKENVPTGATVNWRLGLYWRN